MLVTGGADPRGSQDANYKLSEQRINAVVAALTRANVQVHERTPSGDSLAPKTGLKPEDMARLREVRIFIQRPAKDAGGN